MRTTRTATATVRDNGWQTFSAVAPPKLHWSTATCLKVGCPKLENGWDVRIDESMRAGQLAADYIRRITRRRGWTESKDPSGVTTFAFLPGTPCFQDHRDQRAQAVFQVPPHKQRRVGAPTLYLVSDGNAGPVQQQLTTAGRPASLIRQHKRGADWVEHLAESWNKMAQAVNN